jgi:hypothetical protein
MPARVLCISPAFVKLVPEASRCHFVSGSADFVDAVHIPLSRSLSLPEKLSPATTRGHCGTRVATVAPRHVVFLPLAAIVALTPLSSPVTSPYVATASSPS